MEVAILDYGVGNLFSLTCALKKGGAKPLIIPKLTAQPRYDALILPGVGNFTPAAERLMEEKDVMERLFEDGLPILGICLGMQLLFEESEEGTGKGLGLLKGRVARLPSGMKIPHMGWNNLMLTRRSRLLEGVPDESWVYFVHSYYPIPEEEVTVGNVEYGGKIPAVVEKNQLYGTQFHPEKSGQTGSKILDNFLAQAKMG